MRVFLFPCLCAIVAFAAATPARANVPDDIGGRVIANVDGATYALPLLNSDISVTIEGDMATVEITQIFMNEAHLPMEAEYLFPLQQDAAVYGMEMVVGEEVVTAVIEEKQQAEAAFEQAAKEGKAAALLTQHRPNMFTQRIANLMPGLPVEVTLRYVQMVPKIDGQQELVIPLVVGPRYRSDAGPEDVISVSQDEAAPLPAHTWTVEDVPDHPPVFGLDIPETFSTERVSLDLTLVSGVTLSEFGSPTHPLAIEATEDGLIAAFAQGREMDNRDLVIRYTLGGDALEAASLSHIDERGGFLSLMVEPPQLPDDARIMPREVVFVLDTSGSMSGAPMEASKVFMDAALQGLRPGDYFRIIPFANRARSYSASAVPATVQSVRDARRYVRGLDTGGGDRDRYRDPHGFCDRAASRHFTDRGVSQRWVYRQRGSGAAND